MIARLFRDRLSYHAGLALCDHHATTPCDLLFFLSRDNLNLVCSEAEKFEAVRSCGTNATAVLSYAAGEDEKIHTTAGVTPAEVQRLFTAHFITNWLRIRKC